MNPKKILITRDKERSLNLENILTKCGYEVYFAPLFEIKYLQTQPKNIDFGALIITSVNAIRSLGNLELNKDIEIFSVGKITTYELRKSGFKNIKTAPNQDAASLKELIISDYNKNKEILHICGDKITLDFQEELKDFNITVEKCVSYKTSSKKNIDPEFSDIKFDYILVFSKHSAKLFLELVNKNSLLKNNFKLAKILCFSNKITDEFKNSDFENVGNFSELEILNKYYL